MELFHAINAMNEGKRRHAEVSSNAIQAYRDQRHRKARDRILLHTDSFATRSDRVHSTIAHGSAARQILMQQERSGSELVVVGRHPGSTLSDLSFGSVAGRLINLPSADDRRADMLVVPRGWRSATRTSAVRRLTQERMASQRVGAGAPQAPRGPDPAAMPAGA